MQYGTEKEDVNNFPRLFPSIPLNPELINSCLKEWLRDVVVVKAHSILVKPRKETVDQIPARLLEHAGLVLEFWYVHERTFYGVGFVDVSRVR